MRFECLENGRWYVVFPEYDGPLKTLKWWKIQINYNVIDCDKFSGTIWLCNVVHEFFKEHPERIYCIEKNE